MGPLRLRPLLSVILTPLLAGCPDTPAMDTDAAPTDGTATGATTAVDSTDGGSTVAASTGSTGSTGTETSTGASTDAPTTGAIATDATTTTTGDPSSTSTGDSTSTSTDDSTSTTDDSTSTSTGDSTSTTGDSTSTSTDDSTSTGDTTVAPIDLPPVLVDFVVQGTATPALVGVPTLVLLEAEATDDQPDVAVDFYVDGVLLVTDAYPPFKATFHVGPGDSGAYTLRAVARDTAGQTDDSDDIALDVAIAPDGPGTEQWALPIEGDAVALAMGPDFLVLAGTYADKTWVERRTLDGAVVWSETYDWGEAQDVAVHAAAGRIVVGSISPLGDGRLDLLDLLGASQWDASLGDSSTVRVAFGPGPQVLCAAGYYSDVDNSPYTKFRRVSLAGVLGPLKYISSGEAEGLAVRTSGEWALVTTYTNLIGKQTWTNLYSGADVELWTAEAPHPRAGNDVAIDDQGRVLTVGGSNLGFVPQFDEMHAWIEQRDLAGAVTWDIAAGPGTLNDSYDAVTTRPGGPLAAAGRRHLELNKYEVQTSKHTPGGATQWTATHVGPGDSTQEEARDVGIDAAGAVYVLARESTPNGPQLLLIKYRP